MQVFRRDRRLIAVLKGRDLSEAALKILRRKVEIGVCTFATARGEHSSPPKSRRRAGQNSLGRKAARRI
jgi:hypothetical protein